MMKHFYFKILFINIFGKPKCLILDFFSAHFKGNSGGNFCFDLNTIDLTIGPKQDSAIIWSPRHGRINAINGPCFLLVSVEFVIHGSFLSRLQIINKECTLKIYSGDVR